MRKPTPLRVQARRLADNSSRKAQRDHARIAGQATHLAALLELLHGGSWVMMIDHQRQVVIIARDFPADDRIPKSDLREAV